MLQLDAKVGQKGQAVIPKPIRDRFGIRPGDRVYFRVEDDRIVVETKSADEWLDEFLNACEKRPMPDDIDWDAAYYAQHEKEARDLGLGSWPRR